MHGPFICPRKHRVAHGGQFARIGGRVIDRLRRAARKTAARTISVAWLPLALGSLALAQTGCGSSGGSTDTTSPTAASLAPVHGAYHPSIAPGNFASTIDNRYLPYKPGTTLRYEGVAEDGKT